MLPTLLPLMVLSQVPSCWGFLPAPDSCCPSVDVRGGDMDFLLEGHYSLDTYSGEQVLMKEDLWGIAIITYTRGHWVIQTGESWPSYSSGQTSEECPENVDFGVLEVSCSVVDGGGGGGGDALPWWTILIISLAGVVVLVIALLTWCFCYYNRRNRRQRVARGQGGVVHSAPAQYPSQGKGGVVHSAPAQYPGQVVVEGGRGGQPALNYNTQKF